MKQNTMLQNKGVLSSYNKRSYRVMLNLICYFQVFCYYLRETEGWLSG